MINLMMFGAIVLILCVAFSKILYKVGVPTLLIFMVLGMLAGSDGIGGIYFDDYHLTADLCSLALAFIMFYGGFGTNWRTSRPVAVKAVLLSSLGTILTALLTGLFCYYFLKFSLLEGLLIGSVLASTDAASVFSILRSRKLGLKGGVAPTLEVESGSNDPFSYMLTILLIALIAGDSNISVPILLLKQILFGASIGVGLGFAAVYVLRHVHFEIESFNLVFVMAIAILGYSLSTVVDGNGFLSVYIAGIIIGNSKIFHRKRISSFFDGISWLMQIMLFFVLGLLSFPSSLPSVALTGSLIAIFMIVVARPIAIFAILSFFKVPIKQQLFISWVGIRGAASIVFAIYAVTANQNMSNIFDIVFIVVLFSIIIQGSLIPFMAKKCNLIETDTEPRLKSLNEMEDETYTKLLELTISKSHRLAGKKIMEANLPKNILIVMIKRGSDIVVPDGSTYIEPGDTLVLSGANFDNIDL